MIDALRRRQLDRFFAAVERRALRMARFGTGHDDEALDIVQDAMLRFVRSYADRDPDQWRPLFYGIVQNRLRDWHRRRAVRQRWLAWWPSPRADSDADEGDRLEQLPAEDGADPLAQTTAGQAVKALTAALKRLPARQQQTFLLRAWEGLSVAETARAMDCSEGTVKTQYSRAIETLRNRLGVYWP